MKKIFIPVSFSNSYSFDCIDLKLLPKKIGLVSTINFSNILPKLKNWLKKNKKKVFFNNNGQILGCNLSNALAIENKVDCFLYVGSGKFHPLSLFLNLKTDKPIFIYNPITSEFSELDKKAMENAKKNKKIAQLKFFSARIYGILVSTKPGQTKIKEAEKLRKELEKLNKECYIFLCNELDFQQFENFPQIECWINTACPGLSLEKPLIWIDDAFALIKTLKYKKYSRLIQCSF